MMLGPEETLSSIESINRKEIPSISDVAVALAHENLFPPFAGQSASPTSSILTSTAHPMKVMNQSSSQGSLLDQNTAREILYSQIHQTTTSQHHHQPR
jgi:hypothetical protein